MFYSHRLSDNVFIKEIKLERKRNFLLILNSIISHLTELKIEVKLDFHVIAENE